MNARRFMSDMGFLSHRPTSRPERPRPQPTQAVCSTLSLTRSERHVLEADLNRSGSRRSAPSRHRCTRPEGRLAEAWLMSSLTGPGHTSDFLGRSEREFENQKGGVPHPLGPASRPSSGRVCHSIDELQADLDLWIRDYNEQRPHQGRWFFGKTPMQTFLDSMPIAKTKMIAA